MKRVGLIFFSVLLSAAASSSAWADHFYGSRVRVYVGPSVGWVWAYPGNPYYYGYPAVVAAPEAPQAYIEQEPAPYYDQPPQAVQPQQAPSNYWYYCNKPDGYYPYIKECPGGWQRVSPQPPSQP